MLDLPLELWFQVIDYLEDDNAALKNISRTQKSFIRHARKHLFKRLVLCRNAEYATEVIENVLREKDLYENIKELVIKGASFVPKVYLEADRIEDVPSIRNLGDFLNANRSTFEAYQEKLVSILEMRNRKLERISVDTRCLYHFVPTNLQGLLCGKMLQIFQFGLAATKLPLVRSFDASAVWPQLFTALLNDVYLNQEGSRFSYSQGLGFDQSVLFQNLERITELRYNNCNSAGEYITFEVSILHNVLRTICKRMPNLQSIDISGGKTNEPLNLNVLGQLPLKSLSIRYMFVKDLATLIGGTKLKNTLQNVTMLHVGLRCQQEEDLWYLVFAAMIKAGVKNLRLSRLHYIGLEVDHDAFPDGTRSLFTPYTEDKNGLRRLFKDIISRGGTLRVYWQNAPEMTDREFHDQRLKLLRRSLEVSQSSG